MGALRMAGAVLGIITLGGGSGYAAAYLSLPDPVGSADPTVLPSTPRPSAPVVTKKPRPNNTPALRVKDLEYRSREITVEAAVVSTLALDLPKGWRETRPEEDEVRYTDPTRERYIRVESGYRRVATPSSEAATRERTLKEGVDPEDGLKMKSRRDDTMVNENGDRLDISTIGYTYVPDVTLRYVLVRWVALPGSDLSGVEFSVVGLPQDLDAMKALLDRATKTVVRSD